MKRLTIGISVLALACVSLGQSFTESFDTGPVGWIDTTNAQFGNSVGGDSLAFASGTWHALNNSVPIGSSGWFSNPQVFATHSGAGMANANYNGVSGVGTVDNWLMSPVITFQDGDTISFWTQAAAPAVIADRLYLKMSLNGASTAVSDFTTTLVSINPNLTLVDYPGVWTQYSVTLSSVAPSATTGRFAFNYNVTDGGAGPNSNFIGVDDVSYAPVPEPASLLALGVGAFVLLRLRRRA